MYGLHRVVTLLVLWVVIVAAAGAQESESERDRQYYVDMANEAMEVAQERISDTTLAILHWLLTYQPSSDNVEWVAVGLTGEFLILLERYSEAATAFGDFNDCYEDGLNDAALLGMKARLREMKDLLSSMTACVNACHGSVLQDQFGAVTTVLAIAAVGMNYGGGENPILD